METPVRLLQPRDVPALLDLALEAFGTRGADEEWRWKFFSAPFRGASLVAEVEGRPAAFFGAWATRYRGGLGNLPGVAAVDVMTSRAARALGRHGVFRDLALRFFAENGAMGAPFVFGFPNDRHRKTGERLLEYVEVERCGEWDRPARYARRRRRLFRRTVRGAPFGQPHDSLAEALHDRAGWRTDRSRPTLNWRFLARPGAPYDTIQLLDLRGRSRAYAVLRREGRLIRLVDLQVRDESGADAVELLESVLEALPDEPDLRLAFRAPRSGLLAARLVAELGFAERDTDCSLTVRRLRDDFDPLEGGRALDYRYSDHDVF